MSPQAYFPKADRFTHYGHDDREPSRRIPPTGPAGPRAAGQKSP